MRKTKVLISGGGVPGLCLATILGKAGIEVTVVEPNNFPLLEDIKPSGRTVALWQGSLNVLHAADLSPSVYSTFGCPLKSMHLVDDNSYARQKPVQVEFSSNDVDLPYFGFNIPAGKLLAYMSQIATETENVTLIQGASLESFDPQSHNVISTLSGGDKIQSCLIVGADGRNSRVRETSGIETWKSDYGQSAMTFLIDHSKDHKFISTEFHRPGGPFTIVPLPGKQSSIVWAENTCDAERFMAMNKQDFTQAVQDRSSNIVGEIKLASDPQCWPLVGMRAKTLIGQRTALIAEAAHVISPIGAQGMNLSLRDAAILAEILIDQHRLGMDIGSRYSLEQYSRKRQGDVHSRVAMIDGFNRIVNNNLVSLRGMRRMGLQAIENVPLFKQFVMRTGLTPFEESSRILSGQPL